MPASRRNIPIRIGVNGGSLEKHILARYGAPTPEAMVESALYHVRLLEKFDFNNIVISIKNSNVPMMEAYRQLSAVTDYPLHVGRHRGRYLPDGPAEKRHGYRRDAAGGYRRYHPRVAGCRAGKRGGGRLQHPACRGLPGHRTGGHHPSYLRTTQYPCTEIANEVEKRLRGYKKSIKVAVMGCVVNVLARRAKPISALRAARARLCCSSTASPSKS